MSTRMSRRIGFSLSVVAALVVVGGLFWFLHSKIVQVVELPPPTPVEPVIFNRLIADSDVQSRREAKPRREEPPARPIIRTASFNPGGGTIVAPPEGGDTRPIVLPDVGPRRNPGPTDTDAMPLVRVEPEYPIRAAQHGIEGWATVQFTITTIGTVKDAQVIDSSPPGVFDDAAIKAVLRWKYNPKVVEGTAVERRGVQVRLEFELEK